MLIKLDDAGEPHDYTHPSTADHAESDLNYVAGLEAHLAEGNAITGKNVGDLIAMVRWNATGLLEALRALPVSDGVTDEMVTAAREKLKVFVGMSVLFPSDEAIRAALEAALGATVSDGWEDIATAPRDGTEILLYTDTSRSDAETKSYVDQSVKASTLSASRSGIGVTCKANGKSQL